RRSTGRRSIRCSVRRPSRRFPKRRAGRPGPSTCRSSSTEIHFPPLSIRRDFFAIKYEFLGHVYTLLRNSCFVGSSRNEVPPVRSAKGECCMNVMSAGRMEAVLKAAIAERDRRIADLERQLAALKKQLTAEP